MKAPFVRSESQLVQFQGRGYSFVKVESNYKSVDLLELLSDPSLVLRLTMHWKED